MPQFIIHHEGVFGIWSTIVDAPEVYGATEDEIRQFMLEEYGRSGTHDLDDRIERAKQFGTSSRMDKSLQDMVLLNHAGPDGEEIAYEDVIRFYFVEKRLPDHTATILDRARYD